MREFSRWGMTMRTPAGPVDLVPLFRRLEGDMRPRIPEEERDAAALALTHLGAGVDQIARALHTSHTVVRGRLSRYGMEPNPAPEQFSWTALVDTRRAS
jgi:hypothetical protein